jgi:hypothetical protein
MGILKPVVCDGITHRQIAVGDIVAGAEVVPATNAGTAVTLTGSMLSLGNFLGSPGSASTLTLDTAANIIAALSGGLGSVGIQNGTSFRFRVIQTTAFTATLQATANTGITVNRGVVPASGFKEFLVTIVNGTPAQTFQANTTNASNIVTGLTSAQAAQLSVGQVVINAVNGLQGTSVTAVNVTLGTVSLSGNANATSTSPVAVSFSPVVQIDGLSA